MKHAFRIISRMKGYTALSLLGLIISLSGTVIISRYLYQEWTIDHWMPDLDRTYILTSEYGDGQLYPNTGQIADRDKKPRPQQTSSAVESWTDVHLRIEPAQLQTEDKEWHSVNAIYVDTMFCQIYPLEPIEGTLQIKTPEDAIISEELANRIFPDESAVGKTLAYNRDVIYRIVGVFLQPSTKSLLKFDLALNSYKVTDDVNPTFAIVRLNKGTNIEDFNSVQKPMEIWEKYITTFHLIPYGRTAYEKVMNIYDKVPSISPICPSSHMWMLLIVGILLFLVGLFNFLNLYAVMRSHRRHELEVRRIFGASRWDIFCQLYAETFLLAVLTMIGVWTVVELTEPLLSTYYHIDVLPQRKFDVGLTVGIVFGLPLIVGLIPRRLPSFWEGLGVGIQYFISITLITVSLYLMRQLHFMMDTDPGYRTEHLLAFPGQWDSGNGMTFNSIEDANDWWKKTIETKAVMLNRLTKSPYIRRVDNSIDFLLFRKDALVGGLAVKMNGNSVDLHSTHISPNQFEMIGLSMKEGRMFCDSLDRGATHCILNETALKQLGIKDWRKEKVPLNKSLVRDNNEEATVGFDIVGIMKDFHPGRLSDPIKGAVFIYNENLDFNSPWTSFEYLVEAEPGCEEDARQFIMETKKELFDLGEMNVRRLSDDLKNLYREDRRTARIFFTFSFLAIAVTCLGVLGLMMFDVRRRYREIALRKVNGATFLDIALLLSRRYLIIFAVAAAVSIPVSLIGLHKFITQYYTIHATIAWWIPLLSIVIVLVLCALTLWHQVWKATRIKPYKVLKEN
ncbi:MAG: ABC transporter permease [Bacteroidaceae bacterium]|nr:ABC transporter permease [Bacteroidaceae bacterium]